MEEEDEESDDEDENNDEDKTMNGPGQFLCSVEIQDLFNDSKQ